MSVVEALLGVVIVLTVLFDLFQTVVLPRPTPTIFRPTARSVQIQYALVRRLALALPRWREQLLGTFGPYAVMTQLAQWAAELVLGYGLILHALRAQIQPSVDFGTAMYFSAVSLLTLGFGDILPLGGVARLVVTVEAGTGLTLFALTVTFLFALFGEFQRREVPVITLSARAGAPPSGLALLQAYAAWQLLDDLPALFTEWENWSAQVLESHLSYPILAFFRSTHDNQSWLSALGAVLDATTLILTTVEDVPRGHANIMHNVGVHLVEDLGQYFGFSDNAEPYVEQSEFEDACAELRRSGFRVGDPAAAWAAFSMMRAEYAGALNGMARRWVTPPTQWIGDRSLVTRHSGPLSRR